MTVTGSRSFELKVTYTPTNRISKAKKGKRVHDCLLCTKVSLLSLFSSACIKLTFQVFTRAEHLRRHMKTQHESIKRSTSFNDTASDSSVNRQPSSLDKPPPQTKRPLMPAMGSFSTPRTASKMPPMGASKSQESLRLCSVRSDFNQNIVSPPIYYSVPVRRELKFDEEVPKEYGQASLPSPRSETTISLPSSRNCTPGDSQFSDKSILTYI
ncbi:uncharacterized protein N7511_008482 [Penicillium nucicola]|uniref:uncharacterized protein n=1 Tax=Penicillium nucicola TaxID=1850975 RepID=UPI00254558A7|nr:uncharacterized protein N7511_008482 [Penicillium nucicola]KAJ5751517.1 hypothetical protein N7511_008482 [Penicillium nucicola]